MDNTKIKIEPIKMGKPVKIRVNKRPITFWHAFYILIIINIILWGFFAVPMVKGFKDAYVVPVTQAQEFNETAAVAPAAVVAPVVYDEEWALSEIAAAGIDPLKVKCLLAHESGSNPNAVNPDQGNADLGIFQWSSKYQVVPGFISLACIGNWECETYKFIEKVKQDGNFSAWHGYTKNCLWLEKK